MTALISTIVALAVALGIGVAVWSFLDTRKKYFNEYKDRKNRD